MAEQDKFWLGRLRDSGASLASIVHLKMVVRRAVRGLPDPEEMARQLGFWLFRRVKKSGKSNGRDPVRKKTEARKPAGP